MQVRLTPLPADQWDDEVRGAFKGMLPQARQNPRRPTSELAKKLSAPRVTRNDGLSTGQMTANGPPTAFWHMRQ